MSHRFAFEKKIVDVCRDDLEHIILFAFPSIVFPHEVFENISDRMVAVFLGTPYDYCYSGEISH